jgi:hypothetical protein
MFVAAIDFGTTYSGYAFQTRADFKTDPLQVNFILLIQDINIILQYLCLCKQL